MENLPRIERHHPGLMKLGGFTRKLPKSPKNTKSVYEDTTSSSKWCKCLSSLSLALILTRSKMTFMNYGGKGRGNQSLLYGQASELRNGIFNAKLIEI